MENVTYEGHALQTGELRVYALGQERAWSETQSAWRPMEPGSMQLLARVLYREYFCRYREPVASREQALYALRGARR